MIYIEVASIIFITTVKKKLPKILLKLHTSNW